MIEFGGYFKQFLPSILSDFDLFLNILLPRLLKTGITGDFYMLKRFFTPFIKRLVLVFLLIIQTGAFSSNPRSPNRWVDCVSDENPTIIYNENSTLHLQAPAQACTIIVVGKNTHLIVYSDNSRLLSMPTNEESGWLQLSGAHSLSLYYSGIYDIDVQGKLQEVLLQLPISNSRIIYEHGSNRDYRRLRSAEQLFVPLEFQSQSVTLLSAESV